jgi:hypothetical protein
MSAQAGVLRGGITIAGIEVRILKMEVHNLTSTPTQYPVESGKSIIDHVILNPNVVHIQCEMPNTNAGTERARGVMLQFNQMREKREPIQLMTEHASYKNMVLVALTPVHQAPYKGALVIDLVFQQVGIIGQIGLVSASGGRPAGILAQDGTQATACTAQYSGEQPAVENAPLMSRCAAYLTNMSPERLRA